MWSSNPGHRPSQGVTRNPQKSLQQKAEQQSSGDKPAPHSVCSPGPGHSAELPGGTIIAVPRWDNLGHPILLLKVLI